MTIGRLFSIFLRKKRTAAGVDGTNIMGSLDNIHFGANTSFGGNVTIFATARVEIGDHTMIGLNTVIHTSTHNYARHPMWTERIDRPVKIGKHVWIGTCAVILPGVIIEDFAVVGAGSVVTANVPEGVIVAGNPARILGHRSKETLEIARLQECLPYPDGALAITKGYLSSWVKSTAGDS